MKFFKNIIYTMITAMVLFAVNACKDDFSDEDFFNLQKDAAAAADAQLQTDIKTLAGVNVIAVTSGNPAAGLDVSLIPLDVVTPTPFSGTTDANGVAVFSDVPTGSSLIVFSGTDVVTTRVVVIWDDNDLTNNGNRTVVIKRSESIAVEIYSTDFSETTPTANIKGNVTAELDLTNTTREIPQNLVISADFSNAIIIKGPNSGSISSVTVAGSGDFGSSQIDSLGNYSLVVPANDDNLQVRILIPEFVADQNLAFTVKDGVEVGPTQEAIPTAFGALANGNLSAIPLVPGLSIDFPVPPVTTGSGLALTLTAIPSRLGGWVGATGTYSNLSTGDTIMIAYDIALTSQGGGYNSSPDVTLTGGGATVQNKMYASLEGTWTTLTSTGGANYTASQVNVGDLNFGYWGYEYAVGVGGAIPPQGPPDVLDSSYVNIRTVFNVVSTDATGKVDLSHDLSTFGTIGGDGFQGNLFFTQASSPNYGYRVRRYEVRVSGLATDPGYVAATDEAKYTVTTDSRVSLLRLVNDPTSKTNYYSSAPTITFTGGSTSQGAATVQAAAQINNFQLYHFVDVDNTNTVAYNRMPTSTVNYENGANGSTTNLVNNQVYYGFGGSFNDIFSNGPSDMNSLQMIDGSGNIAWQDVNAKFVARYSAGASPKGQVTEPAASLQAMANFMTPSGWISTVDGSISGLNQDERGVGYTAPFPATISFPFTGLPGSGFQIEILGQPVTGGWKWASGTSGYNITNQGSNYLPNVNQIGGSKSGPPVWEYISIVPGAVYTYDIYYGTGSRLVDVDGITY